MRIMVMGSGGNAGINFCKSLRMGIEDIFILGVDIDKYNINRSNADEDVLIPHPMKGVDKVELVNKLCDEYNIDIVHAQPDPEVRFLLENKTSIEAKMFNHSLAEWLSYNDKLTCQEIWSTKLGLGFTCYPLEDVFNNPRLFEGLQKHENKVWFRAIRGAGSKAALPITSLEHARSWCQYWVDVKNSSIDDFMLCEFLSGKEYAVQTLWINGELIHSQCRERVEYLFGSIMPSGQSSTPSVAKTVSSMPVYNAAHDAVLAISERPHGIYCIDLKENHSGNPIPTEVNYGRLFTTSDFFASVGMNTPSEYCNYIATGMMPEHKIDSIQEDFHWIRGVDSEPVLHKGVAT